VKSKYPPSVQFYLFLKSKKVGDTFLKDKHYNRLYTAYVKAGVLEYKTQNTLKLVKPVKPITKWAKVYEYVMTHDSFSVPEVANAVGCTYHAVNQFVFKYLSLELVSEHKNYRVKK